MLLKVLRTGWLRYCVGLACALGSATWATPAGAGFTPTTTQLPRGVRPLHYAVSLTPQPQDLTFTAQAVVSLEVTQTTRSITLHANQLQFSTVKLQRVAPPLSAARTEFDAPRVSLNADEQTARFSFGHTIPPGQYTLDMHYSGKIETQPAGLFALDYHSANGQRRALFTQFENSDARRMLPCWDEPNFKASFALEVVAPIGDTVVSNMPVAESQPLDSVRKRVRFATTPLMSTYLLFLAQGEFDRASVQLGQTELGVVTQKGALPQAQFVLQSSKDVLTDYLDYFDLPYPLPKLDNVAAPGNSQFFGAMENWGAIMTFERYLLLDPQTATPKDRQEAFTFVAHEMAHQWFGNLVTMRWWDDLWLNEGFASWMEARASRRLHPEWNTALEGVSVHERAMALDAFATTHPVVQHIRTVDQADQAFDAITYEKGQAVVQMLEAYVGEAPWRKGVRRYLKQHALGNTVSDDLWRAMDAATGQHVSAVAHDFTLQPGVPLIRVVGSQCRAGRTWLRLEQAEFSLDAPRKKSRRWRVPLVVQNLSGARASTLVQAGRADVSLDGCTPAWVNAGQNGYFRAAYPSAEFAKLAPHWPELPPIDQLGLLADTWALGQAGLQPATDWLVLTRNLSVQADPHVWSLLARIAGDVDQLLAAPNPTTRAVRQAFARHASAQLSPKLQQLGWQPLAHEAAPVSILRNELIERLSALGEPNVIAQAQQLYAAQLARPGSVAPELVKVVEEVVARHAERSTWDQLHDRALAQTVPVRRTDGYKLLASAQDPALALRALHLALQAEVSETDAAEMIRTVAKQHPDLAFDFALERLDEVNRRVDSSSQARYVSQLTQTSLDPAMPGKLLAYARQHLAPSARQSTMADVAHVRYLQGLSQRLQPALAPWLRAHGANAGATP